MDQCRDKAGHEIARLSKMVDFPAYVKSAKREDVVLQGVCADPINTQFPCHNKEATWLSAAFYLLTTEEPFDKMASSKIWRTLQKAGEVHDIASDLSSLYEKAAAMAASVEDKDEDYALVDDDPETKKPVRKYRIKNPKEVKKSVGYLIKWRGTFPNQTKRKMAERILRKAAELSVDLEDDAETLRRISGQGFCASVDVAEALIDRSRLLRTKKASKEQTDSLVQLAAEFLRHPDRARDTVILQKVADAVDALDKAFDIDAEKAGHIEDVLFKLSDKHVKSAMEEYVGCASGAIYKKAELGRLSPSDLQEYLGSELVERMLSPECNGLFLRPAKVAEIITALDYEQSVQFDKAASASGLSVSFKFDPRHPKLTWQDLEELAELS